MQHHGGLEVPLEEIEVVLAGLGFKTARIEGETQLRVYAPTWRQDMENPYDIVEEILRIKGYDTIPAVPLPHHVINAGFESIVGSQSRQRREWIARRALAARGLCEAVTWSFMREDYAALFGGGQPELMVDNPISQDLSIMRPSILPNLIAAVGRSLARGQGAPAFFEIGAQFKNATPAGQQVMVTGVRSGRNFPRTWQGNSDKPSVYTVKADVMETLAACNIDPSVAQLVPNAPAWYHPGRSGVLQLGPKKTLAAFGEIHPRILKAMDVDGPLYGFEIYLSELPLPKGEGRKALLTLSQYQPVERDLAFILDQDVPAGRALQAIQKVDKNLIKAVSVFDVYEGANLGAGKKSLAFTIRLEPSERTLTDDEISGIMAKIIQTMKQETGGELRS
jgi:phenylalanyl-tRNA synthetase beta chain